MSFTRPLTASLMAVALAAPLSACSPVDIFGPRPDADLLAMARQADADAASLSEDPAIAQLRQRQAGELFNEITRLCGVDSAGQPPSSCAVDRNATDESITGSTSASDSAETLASAVASNASKIPDESYPLAVAQAVDLLAATERDLPEGTEPITDEVAVASATELITSEYAVQFGLDLASAYADDALQGRMDHLRELHDERIDALRDLFSDLPPRAPGYEIDGGGPTTTAEAVAFVDQIEQDLVNQWRQAAVDAEDDTWREAAIRFAAHAQRAAG